MNYIEQDDTLCCCEYFDLNQERNHILACCCNCVDLDEAFERVITGKSIKQDTKTGLMATLHDRIRIPWQGGAKQISFDAILPLFLLPIMFIIASFSLLWTIFAFTTITIFLAVIFKFLIRTIPKTKFFFIWTITSGVLLYCIFEFIVIPFLEILVEENIALSILIAGFVLCVYIVKQRAGQLGRFDETEMGMNPAYSKSCRLFSCMLCQKSVPEKDHHCVWFDCCIGKHNQWPFILALFFAIAALSYSSNLTLTSVCHPFTFYKTILLPDDCSDVYQQFELGLSFVSALYSLALAILMLILLLQQILIVSIGVTQKEWQTLPFAHKLCLGLTAKRPYSRGFLKNWTRIICWSQNHYVLLNQM